MRSQTNCLECASEIHAKANPFHLFCHFFQKKQRTLLLSVFPSPTHRQCPSTRTQPPSTSVYENSNQRAKNKLPYETVCKLVSQTHLSNISLPTTSLRNLLVQLRFFSLFLNPNMLTLLSRTSSCPMKTWLCRYEASWSSFHLASLQSISTFLLQCTSQVCPLIFSYVQDRSKRNQIHKCWYLVK